MCGSTEGLQAHHKDGNTENNDSSNIETLCDPCHNGVVHNRPRFDGARYVDEARYVQGDLFPGLKKRGSASISVYTPKKQLDYAYLLNTHYRIVQKVLAKNLPMIFPQALHIEMNAGPGDGSPRIFRQVMKEIGIGFHAYLIEKCHESVESLRSKFRSPDFSIVEGDHIEQLPLILERRRLLSGNKNPCGLIYCDPNGPIEENVFPTLQSLFIDPYLDHLDVLLNIPAGGIKRARRSGTKHPSTLEDYLKAINKRLWLVREPMFDFQWTFLLGTNFKEYPEFRKHGYHHIDSEKGCEIFRRLNLTIKERGEEVA